MSGRRSSVVPNSKPTQFPSALDRIPARVSKGQNYEARSENGRLRPASNLRLPIFDCRLGGDWVLGILTQSPDLGLLSRIPNPVPHKEMLKMKVDPTMYMKTNGNR